MIIDIVDTADITSLFVLILRYCFIHFLELLMTNLFQFIKAVEVIHQQRLSVAMFAPGWIYETQDKDHFFQHQEKCVV